MLLATQVKPIQTKMFNDHYRQKDELRPRFQQTNLVRKLLGKTPSVKQGFKKYFQGIQNEDVKLTAKKINRPQKRISFMVSHIEFGGKK